MAVRQGTLRRGVDEGNPVLEERSGSGIISQVE
jgi:hypothetical protein